MEPWEIQPELSADRLRVVVDVIIQVRNEIAKRYEPEKGDGPWGQGCGAYQRTTNRIERLKSEHSWLDTARSSGPLSFTMFFDGVPVKIVPSDEFKPNKKSVRNLLDEVEAQHSQTEFPGFLTSDMKAGFCWQIGVRSANASGAVASISVFQANEDGVVRNPWRMPLNEESSETNVTPLQRKPRAPGRPKSSLKSKAKKRLSEDGEE